MIVVTGDASTLGSPHFLVPCSKLCAKEQRKKTKKAQLDYSLQEACKPELQPQNHMS